MADQDGAPAAEEEKEETVKNGEAEPAAEGGENGEAAPKAAAKRRGRPKDENAPKRPMAPKTEFGQELRVKLKEDRPELGKDLKAMFEAINAEWEKVPEEKKNEMQAKYDIEKAKFDKAFAEYRKTVGFREFSKKLKGFLDIKAKKKMIKKHKKEAPLKPKNGYQTFTGEQRKEHEEKLKDMERADVAAFLSKAWEDLGEEKQKVYQDAAAERKKAWEAEMVIFRRTEKYREQMADFVALETKQNIRKIKEEAEDFMPRKPPNAILIWADKTENRGALSVMSEKFKALSEEEQKPYREEAEKLKAEFKEGMAKFHASKEAVIMARKKLMQEKREVVMTARKQHLVDMPKRPGKAHAVFAAQFEGKMFDAKEAWEKLPEEEKQQWQVKRDALLAQWEKDKAAFLETEEYKKFNEAVLKSREMKLPKAKGKAKGKAKTKMEIMTAQLKASMPAKPLKPLAVFMQEKKDTLAEGEKLKDLKRKYDEMAPEEKKAFEEKTSEAEKKYKEDYDLWMKTPEGGKWERLEDSKRRQYFEKRARTKCILSPEDVPDEIKVQATISPKTTPQGYFLEEKKRELAKENPALGPRDLNKKALEAWEALDEEGKASYKEKTNTSKLKNSEAYHKYIDMHQSLQMRHKLRGLKKEIMDKLPKKPPTPMIMWARATGNLGALKEMSDKFSALEDEEKNKYKAQQSELREKFVQEMEAFNKSTEGKSYSKNTFLVRKRSTIMAAKRKFLAEEPKKPPSAKNIYKSETKNEEGNANERWTNLSEEDRKKYVEKAEEKMKEYQGKREEFEQSESFKKYNAVARRLAKPKVKAKGKAKSKSKSKAKGKAKISAKAAAKKLREDSGMPPKPPKAISLFMKENKGGGALAEQHKAWMQLGAEGQKKYVDEAKELQEKYDVEYKEWEKSSKGKSFLKGEENKRKRAKEQTAKEKFLKVEGAPEEPVKPKTAMQIFFDEKKPEVLKEKPDMGTRDMAKELAKMWSGLDGDARKPYQTQATEFSEKYETEMEEYKKTPAYIQYAKAAGIYKAPKKAPKPKAKGKSKAAGGGRGGGRGGGGGRGRGRGGGDDAKADSSSSSSSSSDSDEMGSDVDSD
mmetsp:Transcript_42295/g.78769  ORF Transcript_42295/g.78769 Transcript_42295/m.78769 type:complete len:1093 (-) Transcript_42295:238-3516(-)